MEPLTPDELKTILQHKHASLRLWIDQIMITFTSLTDHQLLSTAADLVDKNIEFSNIHASPITPIITPSTTTKTTTINSISANQHTSKVSFGTRHLSTRDLFKWCARVNLLFVDRADTLGILIHPSHNTHSPLIFTPHIHSHTAFIPHTHIYTAFTSHPARVNQLFVDRADTLGILIHPSHNTHSPITHIPTNRIT